MTLSPMRHLPSLVALAYFMVPASAEAAGGEAAPHLFEFWGIAITNSMLTGWVVSALLAVFILRVAAHASLVPDKKQAVIETLIDGLRGIFEPIVGKKAFPAAFPVLITLFIFILVHNWMGLLPGVGTFGWGIVDAEGHFQLIRPFIRPHNADFNSTIALAILSFGAWLVIIFRYAGLKVILWDLFGNKADKKETPGWLFPILAGVFLLVGCIEVLSILIRPLTLSVRLFGNVYGGENLLHGTNFFFAFYFMELLVGLIQALVFTLLTSVYIGLICNHGDDHEHEEAHAAPTSH